ncbi:MAG: protein translocase subunit SecD [Candidatus Omnitrophica bacterium]|nr:protein translocase subunit SecD [Candidatus Omnitrophota bacterium]
MKKRLLYKIILILGILGICVYFAFPLNKRINLGLDLKGGMHLVLKVDTTHLSDEAKKDVADRALEVIRNRIDEFGVREPSIQKQGIDEIVIQLPGITDRERAIELIGKTALLEFKLLTTDKEKLSQALAGNVPEGYELKYSQEDKEPLLLEKQAVLTGDALKDASVRFNQSEFNEPLVGIEFNPEGAKQFAEITVNNIGRRLAILLDGKVQSAPRIKEAIPSGQAVIQGRFTIEQAQDLAIVLRAGALPAPMYIEEERTVGPSLGRDSISKGVKATIVGSILVFIFMISYYLLAGLVSVVALLFNLIMILGGLGMLPILFPGISATLTLPGIAGIILSLGMAVDANVLINERIREELATGRSLRTAITNGYSKAFRAIFDSNFTTLIAAFLLFQFGTGPIRGFAVTLTIGLLASMFTAIVVTRTILEALLNLGVLKSLPMLRLIGQTKIDFIAKRKIFYALSLIVIAVGLTAFFMKGRDAYGIDFAGGQLQEYSFKDAVSIEDTRAVLRGMGEGDASIQQFKENPRVVLIRTAMDKSDTITNKLKERFPGQEIEILRIEKVGPVAGKHLKTKALKAIVWSLAGILLYVGLRFKHLSFALAGVIALFHDVLVTLGFLAITGRQIDILSITAFLTIAGYSINDTIVIYDRVRENTRLLQHKMKLRELINLSVNQTLSRTFLTSVVTLLVVVSILFYGGQVLSNFAFALFVGFICGTYSTIYIVSPLVLAWETRKSHS